MPDRDPRLTVARRDIASLRREKTIVLALLVQLFIAGFSSVLVVGLTSPYDSDSAQGDVINIGSTGAAQDQLVDISRQNDDLVVETYESRDEAIRDFTTGELDAVVTARPSPAGEGQGDRLVVTAVLPTDDIQSTLVVVTIRQLLANLEETERIARADNLEFRPVDVPSGATAQESDTTRFFGFSYTILIPLLLFLPAFLSGSIVIDLVTEEFERGTMELLRVSPVSLVDIVEGKAAGMVVLAPLQAALWVVLLRLNGISIGHVPSLLVFVTATATLTVSVGAVLGLETGQRRRAQFLYSMLTVLAFAVSTVLPEHPASTVVKLAIDSPTVVTFGQVAGFVVVGAGAFLLARRYVTGVDPESL